MADQKEVKKVIDSCKANGGVIIRQFTKEFPGKWLTYNNVNFYKKGEKGQKGPKYGWNDVGPDIQASEDVGIPADGSVLVIFERKCVVQARPGVAVSITKKDGKEVGFSGYRSFDILPDGSYWTPIKPSSDPTSYVKQNADTTLHIKATAAATYPAGGLDYQESSVTATVILFPDKKDSNSLSDAGKTRGGDDSSKAANASHDWTGEWDTDRGKMTLTQTGNTAAGGEISGSATLSLPRKGNTALNEKPEQVQINAIVLGNKLSGNWSKPPSFGPPDNAGDIMLEISEDSNTFKGKLRYGYQSGTWTDKGWDGDWTGNRSEESIALPPSPPIRSACASAKPSITGGSEFERTDFVIGGTAPQKLKITSSAENFSIVKKSGTIVYERVDGKSWGILTLEPGPYVLTCGGGGAMGLMSARVCIEYPAGAPQPDDTPQVKKKKKKEKPVPPVPPAPPGPVAKIVIRPQDNSVADALQLKVGEEKRFVVAWGEDINGNKISVTVDEWAVADGKIGHIDDEGLFKAVAEGQTRIRATVKNREGELVNGFFPITVSSLPPISIEGVLCFKDEKGKEMNWPMGGHKIQCTYGLPPDVISYSVSTDAKGEFKFKLPFQKPPTRAVVRMIGSIRAPAGYVWEPEVYKFSTFPKVATTGWRIGFCFDVRLKKQVVYIEGEIKHKGKRVGFATVKLIDPQRNIPAKTTGTYFGAYHIPLPTLPAGRYKLVAESKQGYSTLHNWLRNKKDIWVDIPIRASKTIDIEMISWGEKVGYTGP